MLSKLKQDLHTHIQPEKVPIYSRFFKTDPGEYGEGDKFLGITVPNSRKVAKKYHQISLEDVEKLLKSKYHEERLIALLILVIKYEKGNDTEKKVVYDFYLSHTRYINNWDLVDVSCYKIVGDYLLNRDRGVLYKMAKSRNLWEKRISIISTMTLIKYGQFEDTLKISKVLLRDNHDLIHKAVGWMLREVGKKDRGVEEKFLQNHYQKMPRTMLRYAIEKFPEELRQKYLRGKM